MQPCRPGILQFLELHRQPPTPSQGHDLTDSSPGYGLSTERVHPVHNGGWSAQGGAAAFLKKILTIPWKADILISNFNLGGKCINEGKNTQRTHGNG